jgi:MoxR-like ATPase
LLDYMMEVVTKTRDSRHIALGISTRGAIAWHRACAAHALLHGRPYCIPDDIKALAVPTLAHRLVLAGQSSMGGNRQDAERAITELLEQLEVPL